MKPQTVMTSAVACGFGLLALFGVKQATDNSKPKAEPEVPVLVAMKDIPIGVELDETNVEFKKMKKSAVPQGAIHTAEDYKLRALKIPAVMGETILAAKLGQPGEAGVSMTIPNGYRVVSLSVDEEDSFSSMLTPGDRVDVLVTFNQNVLDESGRRMSVQKSKTLLEYLEIFAVDNRTFGGGGVVADEEADAGIQKASHVHLLANPEEAKLFTLAKEKAKLHLAWRSRTDDADNDESIIDESILDDLNNSVPNSVTSNAQLADFGGRNQPVEVESELDTDLDFQSFLDEVEEESIDTLFAPQPTETVEVVDLAPQWTMTIYNGVMPEEIAVERTFVETPAAVDAADPVDGEVSEGNEGEADNSDGWLSNLTEKFGPKL